MNPKLISVDAKAKTPAPRLRARELRRIVTVACRHRGMLAIGLLFTVAFACLHAVSVAGAFPVFKILLEEEGLRGWVDRTLAGHRLGVQFVRQADEKVVSLLTVAENTALWEEGLRPAQHLRDSRGRSAAELLHELANCETDHAVAVSTDAGMDSLGQTLVITLHPAELDWKFCLLRRGAAFIPDSADRNKLRTLKWLLVGLVVVVIAGNVCRYFGEVLIAEAVLRAILHLRSGLYERTLLLPMSFFSGQPASDLVGRFVQDVQEIQRGLLTLFSKFVREPLRAVFILGMALALDWRITLALVVVTPLAVAVFWRVGRSVKKSNRKLLQAYENMIGALTNSLQNLRIVKAYTAERHERERLLEVDRRVLKQQVKLARLQAFVSPMMETVAVVAASFMTVWLASRVLRNDISMSRFATLGVALAVLFDPLRKLTDVYVRMMRATAGGERVFHIIDQPIETDLSPADVELEPLAKSIEFEGVTFTYPGAENPALQDVNISIGKGETIAIVGPNGCGKTTLVSMLPRLFDPDSGEIRYDGVDLRRAGLESLRAQIGLVTQEAVVFAGTPLDNIAYGQSPIDEQRARDAARRASADEFIQNLPGGYEAHLAERGTTLSGGQRQRLAIARAIYRDAPILIFDEATSQVDTESELKIQTALQQFAKGRTTLIIAHRLSTIQFADRIIVMNAGRVIDNGSHKELFDRCTLYRKLCETQFLTEVGPSGT